MRVLGMPLPSPQLSLIAAIVLFAFFFIGAWCEESGWSGYLIDPLQERWGALRASLVLGSVWALWHWMPLVQVGRAGTGSVVDAGHSRDPRAAHLAVQQHRQERVRRNPVPRDVERQLAAVPEQRFALRSTHHGALSRPSLRS